MKEEINFLKEIQQTLQHENIHAHDGQAFPRFWVIMDYRNVPGSAEYDNGAEKFLYVEDQAIEFQNFAQLKDFIEEHFEEEIEGDEELQELLEDENEYFLDLWEHIEDHLNEDEYFRKIFFKEEAFIVPDTMFLTKEEALQHLEKNQHHYTPKAHTYAMTAWRAPIVEQLLLILKEFDWDSVEIRPKSK